MHLAPTSMALTPADQLTNPMHLLHTQLEDLPTGQYYYEVPDSSARAERRYVLLRKAGHGVIGLDRRSTSNICFRGFLDGDRILNAVQIFPPYHPDSKWASQDGELMDLSRYQRVDREITDEKTVALQTCLQFFSR
ncbi:MAG TPA: hypothetical protein V6C57_26180 [Coleofasciculaceae cyanobacterium]